MFYGCVLLLWEQNPSRISRPQLRRSEVCALLTSISKCKQSNYILICICQVWNRSRCLCRLGRLNLTCRRRSYLQYICREGRLPVKVKSWNLSVIHALAEKSLIHLQSELYSTKRLPVYQIPAAYTAVPSRKSIVTIAPTEMSRKSGLSLSESSSSSSRVSSMSGSTTSTKTTSSFEYVWANTSYS